MYSRLAAVGLLLAYAVCCANAKDIDCRLELMGYGVVNQIVCRSRAGIVISLGGRGYCHICLVYVGEGECCEEGKPVEPLTPTCRKPLVCDPDTKKCVPEERFNSSQDLYDDYVDVLVN